MDEENNWVRCEIIQALRQGYSSSEQESIEKQADAVMAWVERTAGEADSFHMLVSYLNDMRLTEGGKQLLERDEAESRENEDG